MNKRFTALMTTLILSVFFSISASAYDVKVDGIYYDIYGTTATVTSDDNKYSGDIVIPESITYNASKYPVTSIGELAFSSCSGLTSITIPNSVTSIGDCAFSGCSGLTSLTIPNSVTSIGYSAFAGCSGLTSITIPNSVTSIGWGIFSGCSGLTSIAIPNSITSIGNMAFLGCSSLTSITIPNSVTSIGSDAFFGCSGLTSITIPNSVTSIGDYAFTDCSGLTSVMIPNSVTSIGEFAFSGCIGLTSITIPNSVTSIGNYAFYRCTGITQSIIVNDMFVFLPTGYEGHYSIPENISTIIGGAFSGCSSLTSVTIPNSVTSIGDYAFKFCSSLTSITIPNSVTSIGDEAFYGCSGLTSVTIPNSVTSIGSSAFEECSGLTSVTIPNSVTSIGGGAFLNCNSIKKLYYDCTANPQIYGSSLKELYIGDNTSIVHDFFKDKNLSKIVLGKNVTQIRAQAFSNSQIKEFTITSEEPPYLYPNVFGTQDLSKATLYVPESKTEYYQTTEPWSKFGKILTLSGDTPEEPQKCATPSISYSDGQLQFSCATEGAQCHYTISCPDAASGETSTENSSVTLNAYYDITCYAKAEGFVNSDVATATLYWLTSSGSLEGAGINNVSMRGIAIQSAGGFINISGLDNYETVSFYGIDGKALGSATAINGTTSFAAQPGSVVVAKIGKKNIKIAVE
ncbi:leucine-rich repeat domain-containing protein [Prevotella sp. P5-92]|uniref:leucine-rich repeat domain-containing protein n=1 Tax=Prevotella sp. P5-92 TaxID=2024222 RepID=UPI0013032CF1|nr:leucine-rich repeat domain-containing protein [Prevotella sp. P5-92]